MRTELIKIYEENPEPKKIDKVVRCLQHGGTVIYPTDTVYGMGCDIFNTKAMDKLKRLKQMRSKDHFSFICYDLSHISTYVRSLPTPTFKLMKKTLPGPFTFILNAGNKAPKLLNVRKKTVGIRIPNHNIPRLIVRDLGHPILTTSIRNEDEILEYSTDPELIYEKYSGQVDIVIDGGYGKTIPSTVVDCTDSTTQLVRQGLGDLTPFL